MSQINHLFIFKLTDIMNWQLCYTDYGILNILDWFYLERRTKLNDSYENIGGHGPYLAIGFLAIWSPYVTSKMETRFWHTFAADQVVFQNRVFAVSKWLCPLLDNLCIGKTREVIILNKKLTKRGQGVSCRKIATYLAN